MKTILLLFGLILSSLSMAAEGRLANVDSSRIQAIALASIPAKYPEINSSKLLFEAIQYSLSASNAEVISVTYQLPSSAETTKDQGTERQKVTTRTETISVRMSVSGKVENVSKGNSTRMLIKPN